MCPRHTYITVEIFRPVAAYLFSLETEVDLCDYPKNLCNERTVQDFQHVSLNQLNIKTVISYRSENFHGNVGVSGAHISKFIFKSVERLSLGSGKMMFS